MKNKTKIAVPAELVYGVHPILELIKAKKRKIISIYTTNPAPKAWSLIERALQGQRVQIQYVAREALNKMAGCTDHQSVIAWTSPFVTRKKFFESDKHPFLLMLDGIQDARNLGAILRTASCVGVDGVIIVKQRGCVLSAASLKASAGLAEHMDIVYVSSAVQAVTLLKDAGYQLYLATLKGKNALQYAYKVPLCLVIGNEGQGIQPTILSSGTQITLPQRAADISYNASVAAGILLFFISQSIK